MTDPIRRGHIYWVPDSAIALPPTPNSERQLHKSRPYLVISNDSKNTDVSWPIVFGYPLSTSDTHATEYDVPIVAGVGGVTSDCYVLVELAQAIAKSKLGARTGQLDANTIEIVLARQLQYFGFSGARG